MAEKINLATLDLNVQELIQKATDSKKAILALKLEQNELKKSGQEGSAQFVRNEVELKNLSGTYRTLTAAVQAQVSEGGRMQNSQMALEEATNRLNLTENEYRENNKKLLALRKDLIIGSDNYEDSLKAINKKLDENNAAIKENVSAYEKQKIGIGDYKNQIIEAYREMENEKKALQDLNTELKEQLDLTDKNSDEYKILNQQINQNITQINVYASNLADARGEQEGFGEALQLTQGGLTGFIQKSKEAGGAGPLLSGMFTAVRTGIIGATKAGIAFIATPIGAFIAGLALTIGVVVGAFKFMTASMNSTEEGSQKLARVTATLTGFFNTFWKLLKPFGEFLGNAFIKYFDMVSAAISTMIDGLKAAAEFVGFDSAAESIEGYQKAFEDSAKAAGDLAKAEGELQKMQRNSKLLQLDYQKQAEKLRQARDDESKSLAERELANINLGKVLKAQAADELAIAYKRKEVADLFIKSEGETTEALDKRAEAVTEIADIEERITGQESEQLANRNSLRKEAADNSVAIEKERQEKIKAALAEYANTLKLELDIYRQSQANKAKAIDQEIAIAQNIKEQQDKIAKAEYDASNKSKNDRLKLQIAYNDNAKELLDSQTAAVLKNADTELERILAINKSKLDNNKFLNAEMASQEIARLDRVAEAQKDNARIKLETEKKSSEDINAALQLIDDENTAKKNEIALQQRDAELSRKAIDLENQRIINAENFLIDSQLQYEQNELKRQQELADITKTAADKQLINDKYDQIEKDRTKQLTDFKYQQRADLLTGLKGLFGQESKFGKVLALAEIANTTAQNATKAFTQAAVYAANPLTAPLAINANIQGGIIVATGIAQSLRTVGAKFEKGGLQEIGGNRHSAGGTKFIGSDGTRFEAEQGELIGVMNRNAAAHFMAFNNAFSGGASVSPSSYLAAGGIADRTVFNNMNIDYDLLASKMAEANASLPRPVVAVEDIATVNTRMVQVKEFANH